MVVATGQRRLGDADSKLLISGKVIEQVSNHKVLGIVVDSELKWLPHIEQIYKK